MRSVTFLRNASLAVGLLLLASSSLMAGTRRPGPIEQSKPAAAATTGGDACTLLTKPDAEAAVGGPVGEGQATNMNSGVANACRDRQLPGTDILFERFRCICNRVGDNHTEL
jgi:hypothetical protein